jgi:ABC-type polar amino acid transport system ATPase subunit
VILNPEITDSLPNSPRMIICEGVRKFFGAFEALKGVTLDVIRGEVVCIIGPSGGGKSTFLRMLNGLEAFDAGRIRIDQIELPGTRREILEVRREVGMVFQSFNLFPHMTVRRNVALAPVRGRGLSWAEANVRAERLLARVGIFDQIDKYPSQLSGGQQQRCRDRARARDGAQGAALRRTDVLTRPRDGSGGA